MATSPTPAAVNVASVPQRSPFRYPGGKTWLIPQVRNWLTKRRPRVLLEPFAGGGSVALTAAAEGLADEVVMVELDPNVAVVWEVILNGDADKLATRIKSFKISEASVAAELAKRPRTDVGRAFHTILRNRTQRGGIMAPGAGLMKAGENGKGISSRWYPDTLANRIKDIKTYRSKITFIHADAFDVLAQYSDRADVAVFADPPYTVGGKSSGSRLYTNANLDHDRLFAAAADHAGDVLMTYDNCEDVTDLAKRYGFNTRPISMRSTHNATMSELLVGRDLSWVR